MKLVNETAPEHFQAHTFYHAVTLEPDSNIGRYVSMQLSHNEFSVPNVFFAGLAHTTAMKIGAEVRCHIVFGRHLSHLHHVIFHFSKDISFIIGNVMHHADTSSYVNESNLSFVDNIPQKFTISVIVSVVWACVVLSPHQLEITVCCHRVVRYDNILSSQSMAPSISGHCNRRCRFGDSFHF